MSENENVRTATSLLSRLYQILCDCRKEYSELRQLLDPQAHLDECPYGRAVNPLGIEFDRSNNEPNN